MREVSKTAGAVDSVRVAVLAALNIADECFRLRRQVREADEKAAKRGGGPGARAHRRPGRVTAALHFSVAGRG